MLEMLPWRQDAEPSPQSTQGGANVKCVCPPCRFNFDEGTPPTNFDTFPAAIMTVFQVRSSPSPTGDAPGVKRLTLPFSIQGASLKPSFSALPCPSILKYRFYH